MQRQDTLLTLIESQQRSRQVRQRKADQIKRDLPAVPFDEFCAILEKIRQEQVDLEESISDESLLVKDMNTEKCGVLRAEYLVTAVAGLCMLWVYGEVFTGLFGTV
ncbi:uncharacterized protein V2V93DRAFT_382116 [Kockiozyma suomiensis]|uniref:uncharacterized protein n=1 Tax=Kockiozyma suomiensis TaxID=1337062 RepID=UPI003343F917